MNRDEFYGKVTTMDLSSLIPMPTSKKLPSFRPGDTIKVSVRIREGDKERIQAFQGVVIKIQRGSQAANFTVRRVSYSVGVERTFLFHSPFIEKVEAIRQGAVRRAKLYYLRSLSGKAARVKEKGRIVEAVQAPGDEAPGEEPPAEEASSS